MKIIISFLFLFLFCVPPVFSQITFTEHSIAEDFDGVTSVYAIDIDGDGDIDVIGAAENDDEIALWENDGDMEFTHHTISDDFDGATSVYAIDMDGDNDIDVIGAARYGDEIAWWENNGDLDFTHHTITDDFNGAIDVYAIDVDGDGDIDVLGAAQHANDIVWWENDGEQEFDEHIIDDDVWHAKSVYSADLDNDGDIDVIATGELVLTWYENDGDQDFTRDTVNAGEFEDGHPVYAEDIDSDGDMDILEASTEEDEMGIFYWDNDGEGDFEQVEIATEIEIGSFVSAFAIDLDNDDDIDILVPLFEGVTWWENDGDQEFTGRLINNDLIDACSVFGTDMDGDGDIDVIGAAVDDDEIYWWENDLDPVNEPPDEFSLLSPADSTVITNFPLWLTWENTTDPDEGDSVLFTVFYSTDEFFTEFRMMDAINAVSDTSVDIIDLIDGDTYWWKVLAEDTQGNGTWSNETWSFTFDWEEEDELFTQYANLSEIPQKFSIVSTYPNPFNPILNITVGLPETSEILVTVSNIYGQHIATLLNGPVSPGYKNLVFDANHLASGIYFIRAIVPGQLNEVRKIILMR